MKNHLLLAVYTFVIFNLSFLIANAQYAYIENPDVFEENKNLPHADFSIAENIEELTLPFLERSNYLLLNGTWKFAHYLTPDERSLNFYEDNFQVGSWKDIPVPSDWQMYGYDYPIYTNWKYPFKPDKPNIPRDFNPVGQYRRDFVLPQNWDLLDEEVILYFGGVNSAYFVWVNGEYVGYSQDSKLPSEFNITDKLRPEDNNISVEVYRYCDGSYLEDQDMWRVSGIERDVYLFKRPKDNAILDYTVEASLDETYQNGLLDVTIWTDKDRDVALYLSLTNGQGQVVWRRYETSEIGLRGGGHYSFEGVLKDVLPWSAEQPNLYSLQIALKKDNQVVQVLEQKVGFRKLEIVDGIFKINGEAAIIKGVNRHEHDADWAHCTGHSEFAFNMEDLREDLQMIKDYGFNAIRTAHYPNHSEFYNICDEIGLYVCDEANIEGHWYMMFKPWDNLAMDEAFKPAILSRIKNMYTRDKNHACVIMWSVGNETGTGKTMVEAYKMLKDLDPETPVFNERHFFINTIKEKHSDFNGNMYAPMDRVKKIIDKDKERPFIWIEYAHAMGNSTGNFKDLWDFIRSESQVQGGFIWDWRDQGLWKENEEGERFLAYGGHFEPEGVHHDENFCANGLISADGKPHPGLYEVECINKGFDLVRDEEKGVTLPISNSSSNNKLKIQNSKLGVVRVIGKKQAEVMVTVNGEKRQKSDNFEVGFSSLGKLEYYLINGDTIISDFGLNFWRAPTDNDYGNGMPKRCAVWREVTWKQEFVKGEIVYQTESELKYKGYFSLPKDKLAEVVYNVNGEGVLTISVSAHLQSKYEIPRVGSYLKVHSESENLLYFGKGPHENYSDRNTSASFDSEGHVLDLDNQELPYIRPQEYGNRTGCHYLKLSVMDLTSDHEFSFSAWKHSLWDIEEYPKKEGKTSLDIPKRDYIWLNIDYGQMGVGGDNSWGRKPYDKYMLRSGKYSWSYVISPN